MTDNERHENIRDEQFWFTATTVGFNGFLLVRAEVSAIYAVIATLSISLFATYLVLTRWVDHAGRRPEGEPKANESSAFERLCYTYQLAIASIKSIPYIIAELSGSAFYILIIWISLVGVVLKNWRGLLG